MASTVSTTTASCACTWSLQPPAPRPRLADPLAVLGDVAEHLEHVEVVGARGGELLAEVRELVDRREELVGGVDALGAQLGEASDLAEDLGDAVGDRRRLGALLGHEVFDEVPRPLEGQGQRAQLAGVDVGGVEQEDRALEIGIVEELVEDARPPTVERHRGRHLVEHLHPRRQLGLDGVLRQQPLRERVQRADGGAVELRQRGPAEVGLGSGARGHLLQLAPDAVAQLGARLLREGDGGDVAQLHRAGGDEGDDPPDERGGLARAGPRLDEQRGVEVGGDPLASGLIGGSRGDGGHDVARLAQGV